MPAFSYMLDDKEMEEMVAYFFELGMTIMPHCFTTKTPPQLKSVADLFGYGKESLELQWHMSRIDFTMLPLKLVHIDEGHFKNHYCISQRMGGPTIDFSSSGKRESDGKQFIPEGSVNFYPTFFDPQTMEEIWAPQEQRAVFRQITRWLRERTIPTKILTSKRTGKPWPTIHIGRKAAIAWSQGMHLGPPSNVSREPKFVPDGNG